MSSSSYSMKPRLIAEKSKLEDERRLEEMQRKLEEALAMRQEAEAKQVLAEKALQDYIATGGVQGKVRNVFIYNG